MNQLNSDYSGQNSMWQPSFNTRATLKQLGVKISLLEQSTAEYRAISDCPNDKEYQYFVIKQIKIEFPILSLSWVPNKNVVEVLLKKRYSQIVITHYKDLFIIKNREERAVIVEPNAAFLSYITCACSSERIDAISKAAWMYLVLLGLCPSEISILINKIADLTAIPVLEIPEKDLVDLIINLRD
jgi:hypothetical protein